MPAIVRRGDANSAGGVVTGPCAPSVLVNGRPVSVPGDNVTPHPCCGRRGCGSHCSAKTKGGSGTVFAEGRPVILVGNTDTCGHGRIMGSPDVFVG